MPTIRANDLEIGFERLGTGPPLILLHAASSSARADFAAQIPSLASAFVVHLPDARGHGATRWDAADGYRSDWLVDDLAGFVDALDLRSFHLVGFSMGAVTALQYAIRHPDRVRTLVLAGISPEREPRASVARRLLDPARIERDDPTWAADLGRRHDPVQGSGAWRRLLPAIAADVATQPIVAPRDLHDLVASALVACGDRDPFVPVDQAVHLARQLGNGQLVVAPDCGHQVMSERAGLLNEALASFYASPRTKVAETPRRPGPRVDGLPDRLAGTPTPVDTVETTSEGTP